VILDATKAQNGGMRKCPDRNPYDSYCPSLFADYAPYSDIGRALRIGDARLRLKEMQAAEETIARQEQMNRQIADRIARMSAEHELNMQYLIQYGVRADERDVFREVLEGAAEHGGLSLKESANLAQAMYQQRIAVEESLAHRNGLGDAATSTSATVSAGAA
jgi:hypothetical protein